jgi:hypothetical protein
LNSFSPILGRRAAHAEAESHIDFRRNDTFDLVEHCAIQVPRELGD